MTTNTQPAQVLTDAERLQICREAAHVFFDAPTTLNQQVAAAVNYACRSTEAAIAPAMPWLGLFSVIAHGDFAHRAWLEKAIADYFNGRTVDYPVMSEKQPAMPWLGDSATGEPVAWMTDDGRVASDRTKQAAMVQTTQDSFSIPLYAAPTSQAVPEKICVWHLEDEENEIWESACGESWSFIDGGPAENSVRFCQGCGGKVKLAAPTPKEPT